MEFFWEILSFLFALGWLLFFVGAVLLGLYMCAMTMGGFGIIFYIILFIFWWQKNPWFRFFIF
jgi:hypothetical protein